MILRGIEALTLEVDATVADGRRANLLLFKMTGLAASAFPFFKFDYFEALWRLDTPDGWLAVKCDIDQPVVRALGGRIVRYPTRAARIVGSEGKWVVESVAGGVKLQLRVKDEDAAEVPKTRRAFVEQGDVTYEIPWEETLPAKARSVRVIVDDDALVRATFGEGAKLAERGVVHRGRVHQCGSARRVK